MCDREGIIGKDYPNLNWMQQKMTEVTNLENQNGTLADALKGADIFVGVSAPNIVTPEMVASMNHDSILFAIANPVPEIMPDVAKPQAPESSEPDAAISRTKSTMSWHFRASLRVLSRDGRHRLPRR